MKSVLILISMLICMAIAPSVLAAVLTDDADTVALWHMDALTSLIPVRNYVLDDDSTLSSRDHNLLLGWTGADPNFEPTIVAGQPGYGNCLSFDGVNDTAYYPSGWGSYGLVTVDFWVKPGAKALVYDPNGQTVVSASIWGISIEPNATTHNPQFVAKAFSSNGGYPTFPYTLTLPAQVDVWQHVIFSVATNVMTLTVDGTSVTNSTFTGTLDRNQAAINICVGNWISMFGATRWAFQGQIDELKISSPGYVFTKGVNKDGPLTKALWHFNAINSAYNFEDDDANHTTRNADLGRYAVNAKINDNSSYPSCVDPVASGVGYPAGNSAFSNCAYFDAISGANCYVLNTLLPPLDMNDLSVEAWIRLPNDFKLNEGIYNQAAHPYYFFDRWGQVAMDAIETATTATSSHSQVQINATAFNKAGGGQFMTYTFPDNVGPSPYQWNHVKFTCIGNTCKLYLNGVPVVVITLANTGGATGLGLNPSKTTTRVGARYNPQQYFYGYVDDEMISKSKLSCGDTGYSSVDFNKDCMVNFKDVQSLASEWLATNAYTGNSGSSNYPTLVEQKWADTGNYNVPKTTIVPTIDGVFTDAEWADARCMEFIAPTLVTAPNHGSYRGMPAPAATDYRCFFYAKWDNTYLYMAGVVDDNDVCMTTGFDEPQLFFNFMNDPAHTTWITNIFCINFAHSGVLNSNGGPSLSNSSMGRVDDVAGHRYVFEAKFKWTDLDLGAGYVPALGDKHGMGFFCQDHNLGGTRVHQMLDFPGDVLNAATNYNTMTLVAAGTLDCHEKLQSLKDFNNDCNVNFKDFATFGQQWLNCTDGSGTNCHL